MDKETAFALHNPGKKVPIPGKEVPLGLAILMEPVATGPCLRDTVRQGEEGATPPCHSIYGMFGASSVRNGRPIMVTYYIY
jgi:hypothetical protein